MTHLSCVISEHVRAALRDKLSKFCEGVFLLPATISALEKNYLFVFEVRIVWKNNKRLRLPGQFISQRKLRRYTRSAAEIPH